MNITGSSLGFASTNLTALYDNTTLDFTRLTISQTDDLISAFSSANSYNWDFKWYWIAAIPLVIISIILPISAGPVLRWMLQAVASYKALSWRLSLAFGFLLLVGLIMLSTRLATDIGYIVYLIVSFGCLFIYSGWKFYWAFREHRNRTYWVLFALFAVFCIVCQMVLNTYFPLSLLPFFVLGLFRGWYYFRAKRNMRVDKNSREKLKWDKHGRQTFLAKSTDWSLRPTGNTFCGCAFLGIGTRNLRLQHLEQSGINPVILLGVEQRLQLNAEILHSITHGIQLQTACIKPKYQHLWVSNVRQR